MTISISLNWAAASGTTIPVSNAITPLDHLMELKELLEILKLLQSLEFLKQIEQIPISYYKPLYEFISLYDSILTA